MFLFRLRQTPHRKHRWMAGTDWLEKARMNEVIVKLDKLCPMPWPIKKS